MFARRHWIPPGALVLGQLAHGFAWAFAIWIATCGSIAAITFPALAWVHVVALGWFTLVALAILLHVVPTFTDLPWRAEGAARWSLAAFALGVVLLVAAFAAWPRLLLPAASLLVAALLTYLAAAFATLARLGRVERTERAIARALAITLIALLLTALAGIALAAMLAGVRVPAWFASLPAAHAHLGMFGWLSLLIFGVSTRTVRPLTGNRARSPLVHILVGTLCAIGTIVLVVGLAMPIAALAWGGAALFAAGAVLYALQMGLLLRRATVTHRPPQAFMAASLGWLLVALALGAGVLDGKAWQLAYGFVLLVGWIGQMVNAHIHHIGVRLIATVYRGEDDETPPQTLLLAPLSWTAFLAFQIAIATVACGLVLMLFPLVAIGACIGVLGWLAMMANLLRARNAAQSTSPA